MAVQVILPVDSHVTAATVEWAKLGGESKHTQSHKLLTACPLPPTSGGLSAGLICYANSSLFRFQPPELPQRNARPRAPCSSIASPHLTELNEQVRWQ
uniref:Ig-like domain-containing protein n=1 Tax=Mesocestoides corti TaxID=53468 RepID=A0A5K3EHP3_MESCO